MTENVNNMSKYNNECMDTNDKDEESITASTNNVKEEMKAEQNEEPIYASLKDNKVSQGNKITDNAEALSINQVTKHEDIQGKGDDEKDKVKEKENGEKVQNNEKSNKEVLGKEYTQHITYEKDGEAIYTDPKTKFQYKWCKKANKWLAKQLNSNPYENEYYRWCNETRKWLPKSQLMTNEQTQQEQQQQQQQQQLQTETEYYKWDPEKRKWLLKPHIELAINMQNQHEIKYDVDENGQHICTDRDGTTFIWDIEKNAWFPKIDDHFMAIYQMNYGFNTTDNNNKELKEQANPNQEQNISDVNLTKMKEVKDELHDTNSNEDNNASGNHTDKDKQSSDIKRKMPESPKWFDLDPAHNTKVYVSNLPLDITLEEFAELMGKCGLIMRDTQTHKYKIKLYTEADGQIKGDGLCDYIKVESVELALKILDEYNLRGHKIRVQRAKFQMRGEYNPALKPKRKKKDKEKFAKIKEKLFDWRPEKMRGERSKHEKIVIIKNLFDPEIFEKDVQLILEYQNDLREECCKCGQVRKITIYDRHTEGVAQINMATVEEADLLIQMMHGRYFGKRQLTAEHWDGKTKYKIEETESEAQKRLNNWDEFLLSKEAKTSQKYVINMDESESRIIQTITECNVNLGEGDTGKQTNDDEGSKKKVTNNAEVS